MTSSLAAQLANVRSHNAERLTSSASLVKHTSYLFPTKTAAQQDLFTVHALGSSGWSELSAEDGTLLQWEQSNLLFGDESRTMDRLMLPNDENEAINQAVREFLHLSGRLLLSKGASKCLEWLVRRFRIHEFSVEDVLAAFLPYHETQQFARMLSICKIDNKPHLQFLLAVKKSAKPLPAGVLHAALLAPASTTTSLDLLRWISGLVTTDTMTTLRIAPHRALVNFWTSTLIQTCSATSYLDSSQHVSGISKSASNKKKTPKARAAEAQAVLTVLLPSAVRVAATSHLGQDAQVGGFMLLCTIAQSFPLSKEAVQGIFGSLAKLMSDVSMSTILARAFVSSAIALCSSPDLVSSPLMTTSTSSDRLVPDRMAGLVVASSEAARAVLSLAQAYESQAFVAHILATLIARLSHDASADLACSILRSQWLGEAMTLQAFELLLQLDLQKDASTAFESQMSRDSHREAHTNRIRILSTLRTEKNSVFDSALRHSTSSEQTETRINAVWLTMQAILAVESGTSLDDAAIGKIEGRSNILWLSIHSPDASQRTLALQQLFKDVRSHRASAQDTMVRDALQSRLQDSSKDVLKALYSEPLILLEAFDATTLLSMLVEALSRNDLDADSLHQHLRFLLSDYVSKHKNESDAVLRRAVWPYLLETPERTHVTKTVRKLILDTPARGLLGVLGAAITQQNSLNEFSDQSDAMAASVAAALAQTTEKDARSNWLDFVLTQAQHPSGSSSSTSREFSCLVLYHLLRLLQGTEFTRFGNSVLHKVVASRSPSVNDSTADQFTSLSLQQVLQHSSLDVFDGSSGTGSAQRMEALIGRVLVQLLRGVTIPGFGDYLSTRVSGESLHSRQLIGSLYTTINMAFLSAHLSKLVLQGLFVRLGESIVPFLSFVWTQPLQFPKAIRLAAIRHAEAYLEANLASGVEAKDYQVILPSLLVPLSDEEPSIRMAAVSALEKVQKIGQAAAAAVDVSEKRGKEAEIFGFDAIYGSVSSRELQYVDLATLLFYLDHILDRKSGFRNDANFLSRLQGEILNANRQDGRKEINQRHSMVCFILSHLLCWDSAPIRHMLLQSLADVSNASKAKMLLPLIRKIVEGDVAVETKGLATSEARESYFELLFGAYDQSCRSTIEDSKNGSWMLYLDAVEGRHEKRAVQKAVVRALQKSSLFSNLHQSMQQELYVRLASIIADPALHAPPEIHTVLRDLDVDASILVAILSDLREGVANKALGAPEAKRARSSLSSDDNVKRSCAILIAVLESIVGKEPARIGGFVYELFEVLRLAVELHSGLVVPSAEHMLQLTMSCISNLLQGLPLADGSAPADVVRALRADVIVNAIKSSNNPQTFQHALLLLSQIAKISPEAVLHNVMPIFTFVGATVLQRDDAFSFSVVENVLKSIVPALVASLKSNKSAAQSKFDLLCEARMFIRIFTDAATHVPRHRRQMFFRLLVDILGPGDFSAGVAMLLVDRSAHKIVRQPRSDAEGTLQLPLAVISPHGLMIQMGVMQEIWEEMLRIWEHRDEMELLSEQVFLDRAGRMDREHIDNQSEPIRQIQALVLFVRQILISPAFAEKMERFSSAKIGPHFESLVKMALEVINLTQASQPAIAALATETLHTAMPYVPIANVMKVVSSLVEEKGALAAARQTSGFALFASRVAAMKPASTERDAVASFTPGLVKAAIEVVQSSLSDAKADSVALRQAALEALKTVSSSATPSEHSALASSIPTLIKLGKVGSKGSPVSVPLAARISVFAITRKLADKLGPRLIPHVAALMPFCLSTVSQSSVQEDDSEDSDDGSERVASTNLSALRTGSLDTITGLFGSVPAFMTSYIPQVIAMSTSADLKRAMASTSGSSTASERSLNQLLSTLIRKTPAKDVFDSSFKIWDEEMAKLGSGEEANIVDRLVGVSAFLARALRQTDRDAVSKTYKLVYRFLLRALDVRRTHAAQISSQSVARIEDTLIGSTFIKMVMKLNEASFRPLFLRMFDWAVLDLVDEATTAEVEEGLVARQIVLFKTFNALSTNLRSLVSSYYAVLLDQVLELLSSFTKTASSSPSIKKLQTELWDEVLRSLLLSARYDEGIFWNPTRVAKVAPLLFSQLTLLNPGASAIDVQFSSLVADMSQIVVALLGNVNDEGTLKLFNSSLLAKASGSRTVNGHHVRLAATQILTAMWQAQADQLLALVPETIAQLSELLDDDNQDLVAEANLFRQQIEKALGESLESYLT